MLSFLIRFLSAILLIWVFRRLLGMFWGGAKAKQPEEDAAQNSKHMVKDPVCGMYMDSRLAVRLQHKQEEFYFCSEDCKQKYLNQLEPSSSPPAG